METEIAEKIAATRRRELIAGSDSPIARSSSLFCMVLLVALAVVLVLSMGMGATKIGVREVLALLAQLASLWGHEFRDSLRNPSSSGARVGLGGSCTFRSRTSIPRAFPKSHGGSVRDRLFGRSGAWGWNWTFPASSFFLSRIRCDCRHGIRRFGGDHSTGILAGPDWWAGSRCHAPAGGVRGEHDVELFHLFSGGARRQLWPADAGACLLA